MGIWREDVYVMDDDTYRQMKHQMDEASRDEIGHRIVWSQYQVIPFATSYT